MPEKKPKDRFFIAKVSILTIFAFGVLEVVIAGFIPGLAYSIPVHLLLAGISVSIAVVYFSRYSRTPKAIEDASLASGFIFWGAVAAGLYAVLVYAIKSGYWSDIDWPGSLFIRFPFVGMPFRFPMGFCIILTCFLVHAIYLRIAGRIDTHSARAKTLRTVLFLFLVLAIATGWFSIDLSGPYSDEAYSASGRIRITMCTAWIGLLVLFWLPGLIVYSVPSSWFSLIPLALHYCVAAYYIFNNPGNPVAVFFTTFAYIPLAGYLFPKHRRIKEYWRPSHLPRISLRRSGFTLIELLICIALLIILSASLTTLSSTVTRMHQRQDQWQRGLLMAQDELALLRSRPQLPPAGIHPMEPQIQKVYEFAHESRVEIKPGPSDRLREVRITVRMRGDRLDKDIELAAILPASPQPGTSPNSRPDIAPTAGKEKRE